MMSKRFRPVLLPLLVAFLANLLPLYVPPALAVDNTITIRNTYTNFARTSKIITIEDYDMIDYDDKELSVESVSQGWQNVNSPTIIGGDIMQASINKTWNLRSAMVTGTISGANHKLQYNNINEDGIPEVTSVETPLVGVNDMITLNGPAELGVISGSTFTIKVGGVTAAVDSISAGGNQVTIKPKVSGSQFPVGTQDIVITRINQNLPSIEDGVPGGLYDLEVMGIYENAVQIVGDIDLSGMTMFPTMGETGSTVEFRRSTLNNYDVYFIKNLNDPSLYSAANKVSSANYQWTSYPDPQDDVVTIKVPTGLTPGPYWIVFTNANSLTQGITARYVYGYPDQQFTVVQLSQQPSISNVDPRKSPSQTQTEVAISGYYFSKANIPGLTLASPPTMSFDTGTGVLDYGNGTLTIGTTNYPVRVKRDFEILVGNILPFTGTGFSYDPANPNGVETFTVNTVPFALDHDEIYDVTVRMTTTLTPSSGPPDPQFTGTLVKEVSLADYYTYSAATEVPEVDDVSPAVIPIEDIGGNMYLHSSMDELMIAIHGDNFLVTRYMDGGNEVKHYPKVTLGNTVINPNPGALPAEYVPVDFKVLKGSTEVEGLPGNEIGDTIIMVLKTGSSGFPVPSPDSRNVKIQNPIRSSSEMSVDFNFDNVLQFMEIDINDFPVISSVTPNMVDVAGGEPVVVAGSNFRTGATVTIDGKKVNSIQISGDNKEIRFNAPAGREGTTQLQVINPSNGGIATVPFTYTQGYSQPDLDSLTPGEGTTNTVVLASGSNFIKPDPTVSVTNPASISEQSVVYRLIGSRILMDGHDINEYNYISGEIQLQPYSEALSGLNLMDAVFVHESDGQLSLGTGFESVVFWDAAHSSFYRLTRDIRNNPVLDNGLGTSYTISYEGGNFLATSGGSDYTVDQTTRGRLVFNGLTLDAYTAYQIENNGTYDCITGNRVQVLDSGTIQFSVPLLVNTPWTGEGLYDVTVENPDTRKSTLTDAFLYYAASRIVPEVIDVVPDQGPNNGGNLVVLTSVDSSDPNIGFIDQGANKTRVWIGTVEVPASDITISPSGKSMTIRMPAYPGDIKALGTDRLTVPINLVNPDGASFSINYYNPILVTRTAGSKNLRGYTYVIPSSHPQLSSMVPNSGSAAGAIIVDIYGSDFRDFEPFTDANGNSRWDSGEAYTDLDGDGAYTAVAPQDATHKTASQYNSAYQVLTSPLLPQVYFGQSQAEIVDYNSGWLQVVIPPGTGSVDVYVANNDSGISNRLKYSYVSSKPTITSVSPNIGDKKGGTDVEIAGTDFQQGPINIMTDQVAPSGLNLIDLQTMPLVKTGEVSNRSLAATDSNSGRIQSSVASVSLAGDLTARYNASTTILEVGILDEGVSYTHSYGWDGSSTVYINTQDLSDGGGTRYPYQQLIRFQILDNRLLVEAGYAPDATLNNSSNLSVQMPCYYTVGSVPLMVMNPDGGQASSTFTYTNPASHPVITDVTKDGKEPITVQEDINGVLTTIQEVKLTYKGGNVVAVLGNDFRENAIIQIGTIATIKAADIAYDLPGKMSFTMPAVPESEIGKLHRVLVINEDGASASSDKCSPPIYVKFVKGETAPAISSVTPSSGPAAGNTAVTISGSDFRDGLTVTFGGIQAVSVIVVDYKTVTCVTPAHAPGKVEVKIENPDGELSDPNGEYTYVSNPTVSKVVDAADPTESQLIKTISINGGQNIKVKGSCFMEGARVVFAPKVTAVTGTPDSSANVIYINGSPYTLDSGTDGSNALFIDEETLTVTTPAGQLGTSGLMVINPDGGASSIYTDITYTLPQIQSPLNVVAELVHDSYYDTDRYIKVHWDAVEGATGYEIYVVADDQKEFIGTTTETAFLYKSLKPNTRYKFVITAVWDFASSPPSAESNSVKTGDTVGNPDLDAGLNEKTTSSISGDVATITIGTSDYKKSGNHTFDLTTGSLAAARKVVIVLPAYVISRTDAPDVEIIAHDFNLTFNPSAFYVDAIKQDPEADDAGVRFSAGPYASSISADSMRTLCRPFNLEAQVFKGQASNKADTLVKNIQLGLDYDSSLLSTRRLKNPSLCKYNASARTWDTAAAWRNFDPFEMGRINQMGTYAILGSR